MMETGMLHVNCFIASKNLLLDIVVQSMHRSLSRILETAVTSTNCLHEIVVAHKSTQKKENIISPTMKLIKLEMIQNLFTVKRNQDVNFSLWEVGSGCGSAGRAVAYDTRDPWFKSQHLQSFIYQLYFK